MSLPQLHRKPALLIEMGVVGGEGVTEFDSTYPYSYCRICGFVYQPPSQREPVPPHEALFTEPNDSIAKKVARRTAMVNHEKKHERDGSLARYARSGLYFTPEAQHKLAAYGIVNALETAFSDEHDHAARTSKNAPNW